MLQTSLLKSPYFLIIYGLPNIKFGMQHGLAASIKIQNLIIIVQPKPRLHSHNSTNISTVIVLLVMAVVNDITFTCNALLEYGQLWP